MPTTGRHQNHGTNSKLTAIKRSRLRSATILPCTNGSNYWKMWLSPAKVSRLLTRIVRIMSLWLFLACRLWYLKLETRKMWRDLWILADYVRKIGGNWLNNHKLNEKWARVLQVNDIYIAWKVQNSHKIKVKGQYLHIIEPAVYIWQQQTAERHRKNTCSSYEYTKPVILPQNICVIIPKSITLLGLKL